ncbi:MAG TPA: universal stress protein, partial [Verrucomicrobiae bacterium]|nr:universal stress protein [Verrucomicrobiae bacterium]
VLATHQRSGLSRWLHEAVAEPVARQARLQTLFVPRRVTGFVDPATGEPRLRNILIPVDRDPDPSAAVEAAVNLASTLGCRDTHFSILHVGPEQNLPPVGVPLENGWTAEKGAWTGDVVERVLEVAEARDADLIVMATRGHHGFLDALRGSTTERVLRGAKCPVLAVPAG